MRRRVLLILAVLLALPLLITGGWGVHRWWTYPKYPDVNTASIDDILRFMSSDDFRRLLPSHQQSYTLAEIARLDRDCKFPDLVRQMTSNKYDQEKFFYNLRHLPDFEACDAQYVRVFLDKFFELDENQRTLYLAILAGVQQSEMAKHPERFGLPTAAELKNNMSVFFTRQPPRVQGQLGQFLRDYKRQRAAMGLKEPF